MKGNSSKQVILMLNEDDYPMTYKEFDKSVVELFLQDYEGEALEIVTARVDEMLSEEPNFIHTLYGHCCFVYESPHIYGENCKKMFEDYHLRETPVANLRMIIG